MIDSHEKSGGVPKEIDVLSEAKRGEKKGKKEKVSTPSEIIVVPIYIYILEELLFLSQSRHFFFFFILASLCRGDKTRPGMGRIPLTPILLPLFPTPQKCFLPSNPPTPKF